MRSIKKLVWIVGMFTMLATTRSASAQDNNPFAPAERNSPRSADPFAPSAFKALDSQAAPESKATAPAVDSTQQQEESAPSSVTIAARQFMAIKKIEQALAQTADASFFDETLELVLQTFAEKWDVPVRIDLRALDNIGLTADMPVTISIENISWDSLFSMILRDLDLTITIENEVLEITTIEAAEQRPLTRIYWSNDKGLQTDANGLIVILTAVDPGIWQTSGGPGNIAAIRTESGSASGFVVSAPYSTHRKLKQFFALLESASTEKIIAK